jgi:hypothetical protein
MVRSLIALVVSVIGLVWAAFFFIGPFVLLMNPEGGDHPHWPNVVLLFVVFWGLGAVGLAPIGLLVRRHFRNRRHTPESGRGFVVIAARL